MSLTNSFTAIIDNIVTTLAGDAPLNDFCKQAFSRRLKVVKQLTPREDVTIDNYPLIMITRPEVDNDNHSASARADIIHTVKLYCGFRVGDSVASTKPHLDELIQFDEYIDQALLQSPLRGGLGLMTKIGKSVNDQGAQPPEYFTEKLIYVTQRIQPTQR